MMPPFGPTAAQVEACAAGRHSWLVVARTTFRGYESTSLTCEHCPTNGYRIKEIDQRG